MAKNWWKVLTALLLLYVLIAGMLVPLKPGIVTVSPTSSEAGELLVLRIKGYNTDFEQSNAQIRAWLKVTDKYARPANQVLVQGPRSLRASFSVPKNFPLTGDRHLMSVVLDDPVHGPIVSPDAVVITDCAEGGEGWTEGAITALSDPGTFRYPYRTILYETIRNTYYHVPMWFGMIILFFASAWHSIKYIRKGEEVSDMRATALVTAGTVFGILGLVTGMWWSNYTWGAPWSWDVKQNTSAICLLIYMAYFILRSSFEDPERKARISAAYNVFAAAMIIPLLFVIPRMTDSLHPGNGGNPAFGGEDLDNTMRMVFYPAVIAWTLLGLWISNILFRLKRVEERISY